MYSQAKTKYELLQEELDKTKKELEKVNSRLSAMGEEGGMVEWLPCNTLPQKMMIDKLRENWDTLTLEDIEAICRI